MVKYVLHSRRLIKKRLWLYNLLKTFLWLFLVIKKKFFQKLRSQGKSHSQLVNFSGARPFMKPLYMKSYMRYRPSQFAFLIVMVKWSLSVMKYVQKCPRNQSKKIQILGGDGINSKLKLRKAQYSILCWRFCVPYGRVGDWCRIQENWHVCQGWYWHIIKLKEK